MAFGFIQYKQPRLCTEVTLLLLHIPAGGISGSTKKNKKRKGGRGNRSPKKLRYYPSTKKLKLKVREWRRSLNEISRLDPAHSDCLDALASPASSYERAQHLLN